MEALEFLMVRCVDISGYENSAYRGRNTCMYFEVVKWSKLCIRHYFHCK